MPSFVTNAFGKAVKWGLNHYYLPSLFTIDSYSEVKYFRVYQTIFHEEYFILGVVK
jgi:hypothetical protein